MWAAFEGFLGISQKKKVWRKRIPNEIKKSIIGNTHHQDELEAIGKVEEYFPDKKEKAPERLVRFALEERTTGEGGNPREKKILF